MSTAKEHSSIPSTAVEFAPGLWRTNLQRYDLPVPGREMTQSRVDIEPDSAPIRHAHPGEEIIYVLEGSLEYQIEGQPTKVYNAGEALTRPGRRNPRGAQRRHRHWHRTRYRRRGEGQAAPHRGPVNARPGRRMAP